MEEEREERVHQHDAVDKEADNEVCANSNMRRWTGRLQRGRSQSGGPSSKPSEAGVAGTAEMVREG